MNTYRYHRKDGQLRMPDDAPIDEWYVLKSDFEAEVARLRDLEAKVRWVLTDAAYKPPEDAAEFWATRWEPHLRAAINSGGSL